jgi:hypothetical protein
MKSRRKARQTKCQPRGVAIAAGKDKDGSQGENVAGNYGWQVVRLADGTIENTRLMDPRGAISWVRMETEHASASLAIGSKLKELKAELTTAIESARAIDDLHPWQSAVESREILQLLRHASLLVGQGLSFCPSKKAHLRRPPELANLAVREMARRGIAKPMDSGCLYDDIRARFLEKLKPFGVSTENATKIYEQFCAGAPKQDLPRKKLDALGALLGRPGLCDEGKAEEVQRVVGNIRVMVASRRDSLRHALTGCRK